MQVNYNFFDYKRNIAGFDSDLFSTPHLVFIVLAAVSALAIGIALRNASKRKVALFLKIMAVFIVVWDVAKIVWESYYDITVGDGFNTYGLLPLYTCDLFMYTALIAAWGRGKAKDISLAFLGTVGLISGLIGVIYCNGLNFYPFWTYGAFYSLIFHYAMFITGVIILASGYKKLGWFDAIRSWVSIVLLSLFAIPVNYYLGSDYMQLYSADGVPLMNDLAVKLAASGLRPVFTAIMLLAYIPLSASVIAVYKCVKFTVKKLGSK